jgi:Uma2 family endonuclease
MGAIKDYPIKSKLGEPVWELATMHTPQGDWTVDEYLALTVSTNRLIEFNQGFLEFPAMPTRNHQEVVAFLYQLLLATLGPKAGVWFAPIRVRVAPDKFREPDIIVFRHKHDKRAANEFFDGADLVMEVVSPDEESHERDYVQKRKDYAAAGIPEYWIVDPNTRKITVLKLAKGKYIQHAAEGEGQKVTSATLKGVIAEVTSVFTQS